MEFFDYDFSINYDGKLAELKAVVKNSGRIYSVTIDDEYMKTHGLKMSVGHFAQTTKNALRSSTCYQDFKISEESGLLFLYYPINPGDIFSDFISVHLQEVIPERNMFVVNVYGDTANALLEGKTPMLIEGSGDVSVTQQGKEVTSDITNKIKHGLGVSSSSTPPPDDDTKTLVLQLMRKMKDIDSRLKKLESNV